MNTILTQNLFYITPDVERAEVGLLMNSPFFYIITNHTPYSSKLAEEYKNITLIKETELLATHELLKHPKTIETVHQVPLLTKKGLGEVKTKVNPHILVFKNTSLIEKICAEQKWQLLNPSAELAKTVEEKISQVEWLDDLQKYLPSHKVEMCKNILPCEHREHSQPCQPFIIQFNRAHSGEGTHFIDSTEKLVELQNKFPNRDARVTDFIEGPMFTVNIVVGKDETLIGNVSYQITGLLPFTSNKFATIGNDWKLPKKILDNTQITRIERMCTDIAKKLREENWKGLFGIDVILDKQKNKIFLIEINARQPASTSFESKLQSHVPRSPFHVTTFEAHVAALLDHSLEKQKLIPITSGAQIIQRKTNMIPSLPEPKCFAPPVFEYIYYPQSEHEDVLLRMQTTESVMEDHNKLNRMGNIFVDFIFVITYKNTYNAPRGAAIIIRDNKLLLIERHKLDRHYFILPGGTVEEGEDVRDTTIRELQEETGYEVALLPDEPIVFTDDKGRHLNHFFAQIISGEEKLGGPEAERNDEINNYAIVWKNLDELNDLNIIPEEIKKELVKRIP